VAGRVFRVVDFNANSFLEPAWPDRRYEIVAWLDRLQPDVVCLQEIWQDATHPNTAGGIVDEMTEAGWHWYFGGRPLEKWLWPDPAAVRIGSPLTVVHRLRRLPRAAARGRARHA
jgi:Endonuclease/Exonuclease/phosphatase family